MTPWLDLPEEQRALVIAALESELAKWRAYRRRVQSPGGFPDRHIAALESALAHLRAEEK